MQKRTIIKKIKAIIEEYGSFSTADVESESSPIINSFGKDSYQLAERFNNNGVTAVSYVHETETDEDEILYEDLPKDVLEEILSIAEDYEVDFERTMKRCRD